MGKRKEVDGVFIDASDLYCSYLKIEKYLGVGIPEITEKFTRTALGSFVSFIIRNLYIKRKFNVESHLNILY